MTDAIQAWAEAFTAAQAEFPVIEKKRTADTGKYTYSYADLGDVLAEALPVLHKHGLSLSQPLASNNGNVGVGTRIYHVEGHVEEFGVLLLPGGGTSQTAGSALTYARRYAACSALGIATEDDDGAAASTGEPKGSTVEPLNDDDPHCPACLHINGELVGLWENDKKPFQRCKNKPGDCAGTTESNGKEYQWAGWNESWERSVQEWVDNHPEHGEQIETQEPSLTPREWLKARGTIFSEWTQEEKKQAYEAVKEELRIGRLSSQEQAEQIFEGMTETYYVEHPNDESRPF